MANPTKSGLYLHAVEALFKGTTVTGGPINITTAASMKIAAYSSAASDGVAPLNFSAASIPWSNASEATSTANWPTGGVLLSTAATGGTSTAPTFVEGSGAQVGSLVYDMGDVLVASTTFATGPYGVILYFDAATSPADLTDAMICAVNFGAAYPTNNGSFGIQWSNTAGAVGVFSLDLTP